MEKVEYIMALKEIQRKDPDLDDSQNSNDVLMFVIGLGIVVLSLWLSVFFISLFQYTGWLAIPIGLILMILCVILLSFILKAFSMYITHLSNMKYIYKFADEHYNTTPIERVYYFNGEFHITNEDGVTILLGTPHPIKTRKRKHRK